MKSGSGHVQTGLFGCKILRISVFKGQQSDWVEEFVDITDEDVEATFQNQQRQFWQQLEDEWRDMAQQNKETGEHPWLDDFEEVL